MLDKFVPANVERADDHRLRFERRRHLPIRLILLLLVRHLLAIKKQKLRAEQPHPVGPLRLHGDGVPGRLDVRGQRQPHAIERDRRILPDGAQLFIQIELLLRQLAISNNVWSVGFTTTTPL